MPKRALIGVVVLLLAVMIPESVRLYTDWLWFGETGYQPVFSRTLVTRLMLGLATFVLAFGLLFGNAQIALQAFTRPLVIKFEPGPLVIERRQLGPVVTLACGLASLSMALAASGQWLAWLYFLHGASFQQVDPTLGKDIGYYIFRLPFLEFARGLLLLLVAFALAGSLGLHWASGGIGMDERSGIGVSRAARRHLSFLAASLFVLLAFSAYLDIPRLLLMPSGIIHGISYVDVAARLPSLQLQIAAALVGAALAIRNAYSSRLWPIGAAIGVYIGVLALGSAYAAVIQKFVVTPNEQVKEAPFIASNVSSTRKAFGLDAVEERELSGDALLTREDIASNAETIRNVRLWDHKPLLDTFGQIQEIRTYYDFVSVDNDRYVIDGEYRQIMLSARELNSDSLPNRSWPNERLTFTHGYGLALGPVNQVTQEGLPVLFIKNLPPESTIDLKVTEPSIYFGELSNDHVFVKTTTREFHYPKGEDNVYQEYAGEGGVSVDGFLRKLLFSIRFRSHNLLFSREIQPGSRILFNRRISERLKAIAPFLQYDGDPYLVVSEGRMFWIQDAYTTSRHYPGSTPIAGGTNYIRNSVKVVIDAYHGKTTYYLADPHDPIAVTLGTIFPGLFRPLTEMSPDLQLHLRYPEAIFSIQAAMYSTYHMTNPAVFYNKEDQWEVPSLDSSQGVPAPIQPYYTIMKLPGEAKAEFIQILPFTPRGKDNLAAWMVARSDGEHYGKLLVFQFPKQKVVFGPRQIVARINQDQVISPQITLWNQQGSEVIQGTLLVIPIEESLLYVRPLYLRGTGGRIAELKRVVVAYQNQIVMEETLEGALNRIFEPASGRTTVSPSSLSTVTPPPDVKSNELGLRAREHYERAIQAQREGDWGRYGEEIRKLGETLEKMAQPR